MADAIATIPDRAGPRAEDVLGVIRSQLQELRRGEVMAVALDDELERDLGLDSLMRTELMLRLEQAFGVRMEEAAVLGAETPRDLIRILRGAPARTAAPAPDRSSASVATAGAAELPRQAQTLIDVLQWHAARRPQGDARAAVDRAAWRDRPELRERCWIVRARFRRACGGKDWRHATPLP